MATYHYTGSDTTEDYWNEWGDQYSTYIVRSYGLSDFIHIAVGLMDIDAGAGNDDVEFLSTGVAKLGDGDDSGSIGAQKGDSTLYGDAGDDSLFIYTYAAIGSLAGYGGVGNDFFSTSNGGTALLNGGTGFDMIGVGSGGAAILGKTLISIEGQWGSNVADSINSWGTDELAITTGRYVPLLAEVGITTFRNVLIGAGGSDTLNGSGGNDLLIGTSTGVNDAAMRSIANYRTGITGLNIDYIPASDTSDSAPDTLIGGAGNDFLSGGYGADDIDGGSGIDTVAYSGRYHGDGGITVWLASGSDYAFVSDGDKLRRVENVIGSDAADDLRGTVGRNLFFGLSGDDTLDGGTGNDLLDGGDGNDRLLDADGGDTLRGGDGDDSYSVSFASTRIVETRDGYYGGGQDDIVYADLDWRLGANLENLSLVFKYDQLGNQLDGDHRGYGNELANTLNGNRGDNLLDGVSGWDELYGGAGKDRLLDRDGGDRLEGGTGDDTYYVYATSTLVETLDLASGGGIDTVRSTIGFTLGTNFETLRLVGTADISGTGNDGNNSIFGNVGRNTLLGLGGNDTLLGGGGTDRLEGGAGLDSLRGGKGEDTLLGDADGDRLLGESGNDTLDGGAGADKLWGGVGHDLLLGGSEADTLLGDAGNDTLDGGAGADFLVFEDAFGADKVVNFEDGLDRINLRDFREENGGATLSFNQLLITQAGTSARIQLDLDRNRVADTIDLDGDGLGDTVRIELVDRSASILSVADFLL
jgi:Ca2+-binding RTX toxin-like protein